MGRPKGSKNKPKDGSPAPAAAVAPAPVKKAAPAPVQKKAVEAAPAPAKKRDVKVVAPKVGIATGNPTADPAPVVSVKAVPTPVPVKAEVTKTPAPKAAGYTIEDLQDPALDKLEAAVSVLLDHASAHRRVYHESRALPGVSIERSVLKVMIDYFEIDVQKIIKLA